MLPWLSRVAFDETGLIRIESHVVHTRRVAVVDLRVGVNESRPLALLSSGTERVRRIKRAQILLAADRGASDAEIAGQVGCALSTVSRTKRRFVEGSLEWPASSAATKRLC